MKSIIFLALTASLFITANANAFLNESFETGDLTGWTFSAGGSVVSAATGFGHTPDWSPTDGDYFAYLTNENTAEETIISPIFTADTGNTLEFDIFFDTSDYYVYDDWGGATLQGGGEPIVLYYQSVSLVGDSGADGWTHVSYAFNQTGEYFLEFKVVNQVDLQLPSAIGVDNVTLVPEPCTLTLLSCSGLALRWRK